MTAYLPLALVAILYLAILYALIGMRTPDRRDNDPEP